MRRPLTLATSCATAVVALCALSVPAAQAADGHQKPGHYTFAVIGDVPYGADQVGQAPRRGSTRSTPTPTSR